jgi:hypothetical protein
MKRDEKGWKDAGIRERERERTEERDPPSQVGRAAAIISPRCCHGECKKRRERERCSCTCEDILNPNFQIVESKK